LRPARFLPASHRRSYLRRPCTDGDLHCEQNCYRANCERQRGRDCRNVLQIPTSHHLLNGACPNRPRRLCACSLPFSRRSLEDKRRQKPLTARESERLQKPERFGAVQERHPFPDGSRPGAQSDKSNWFSVPEQSDRPAVTQREQRIRFVGWPPHTSR
jgi:hypothetical protein